MLLDFSDRTRTGFSKLISRCARWTGYCKFRWVFFAWKEDSIQKNVPSSRHFYLPNKKHCWYADFCKKIICASFLSGFFKLGEKNKLFFNMEMKLELVIPAAAAAEVLLLLDVIMQKRMRSEKKEERDRLETWTAEGESWTYRRLWSNHLVRYRLFRKLISKLAFGHSHK